MENYEQVFIFNGYNLSGTTNVSANFSISEEIIRHNAASSFESIVNAPIEGQLSITRNLLYNDPVLAFTGTSGASGSLNYGNVSFGFTHAYLSSYQIEASVSNLPTVTTSFDVVGNLGSGIAFTGSKNHPQIYQPTKGSIFVTLDKIENQPLQSVSISYQIDRSFDYLLGQTEPEVSFLPPITEEVSLSFEVEDYESEKMKDYLTERSRSNILINFNDFDNSTTYMSFNLVNAKLISTNFTTSSNDRLLANLNYRRFLA